MHNVDLVVSGWDEYELLDSGGNSKLERFGRYVLARPETQAIWQVRDPRAWERADARFIWSEGKGKWNRGKMPESWDSSWGGIRFRLRLTSFKHTGVFPEQAANWEWIRERVNALDNPRVLNLFGYTGVASLVAAAEGANVTHVDASKQSNLWLKENAQLSGIAPERLRIILDDALKFTEREVRRGAKYDGIILDPPAFGRGAKGEVWRIEEDITPLLTATEKIFSGVKGSFFLLNGYAAGYAPTSFAQAVENCFEGVRDGEYGELHIGEKGSTRVIPAGIYVRFSR
jgi:23S rRNA (cytosine1962-C5)-methyltransferase